MKYGKLSKKTNLRNRFLTVYFLIGSVILLTFFIIYTNYVINDIKKDVKIVPDLYSKFLSLPSDVNMEHFLFQYFMEEVIPEIDYPIILVDSLHTPFSWINIDIPKKKFDKLNPEQQKQLRKMINKMKAQHSVIPLRFSKTDPKIYSYVYFGDSKTMRQLKVLPFISEALVIIFILLGIYGIISIKRTERNVLWVGLAKETAHQFGTPLSSLSGWMDILRLKLRKKDEDEEILQLLDYMQTDTEKLNRIASRFGKVGSDIKRQEVDIAALIEKTIEHFKRRLPNHRRKITIAFHNNLDRKNIQIDPDLIQWTLENLIKNSIDSMIKKGGKITVKAFSKNSKTHIQVADEGSGMPKAMFNRIFKPGVTSKKRGWGLGLSLAKRIIDDYHKGKIKVLESEIGKGTTFQIILPEE